MTEADRLAEEFIRGRIEKRYPLRAIVGEEFGIKETGSADHKWFIDPIDGTKSFVCGVPLYAVLLGLEVEGVVSVGAAYFPAIDEMLAAAQDGLGCWWNGRMAHVSTEQNINRAIVAYTGGSMDKRAERRTAWDNLQQVTYYQAGWGDAYRYLLVATGRIEVMLDPVMIVWDCGPFPPILGESGGYFGDWQGNPTIYGGEALATSNLLLPEVLRLIIGI